MTLDSKSPSTILDEEATSALWIAALVEQVKTIVEQSGDPTNFDAYRWVANWINTPVPALGGQLPIGLMQTPEGRELVASILAKMQSGAYA
jgi:uncharacterized protein (DUF2384 family)